MKNNCVGFISKETGKFEPLTNGQLFNYPGCWTPVYKNTIGKNQVLNTVKLFPESKEALRGLFPEFFELEYDRSKIYCFAHCHSGCIFKLHLQSDGYFVWISMGSSDYKYSVSSTRVSVLLYDKSIKLNVFNNQKEFAEWMYSITK